MSGGLNPQVTDTEEDENLPFIAAILACAPRMNEEQAARLRRLYKYGPPDTGRPAA